MKQKPWVFIWVLLCLLINGKVLAGGWQTESSEEEVPSARDPVSTVEGEVAADEPMYT